MNKRPAGSRLTANAVLVWALILAASGAGSAAAARLSPNTPHRLVFWGVERIGWTVYPLLAVLVATLLYVPFRRAALWRLGRPSERTGGLGKRLRNLALGAAQHRVPRDRYAGLYHLCIYSSILALTLVTLLLAIDHEIWEPLTGEPFLRGPVFLGYKAFSTLFGLVGLAGVAMAGWRRYVSQYPRLEWDVRWEDQAILAGLAWLLISGFLVEGLRVGADEIVTHPTWSYFAPVAWVVARIFIGLGASTELMSGLHNVFWALHMPVAFAWLGLIAFTKLGHIYLAPANAFLRSTEPYGRLTYPHDLTNEQSLSAVESFGAGRLQDLSWKQLFESDVCVRCGRCTDACPANIAGQPLSPMAIIQGVKAHMSATGPLLLAGSDTAGAGLVDAIGEDALWSCRTCGACMQECPVYIEHVPTIVDMRRWLVMDEARVPATAQAALQNIEQRGHPWHGTALQRTTWMETIGVDVPEYTGEQEYLYWVGCTGALVERNVPVTQAVVRLLLEAKVSFGVLGPAETCNGDPARRLGNEFLFQTQAQQVVELFKEAKVHKVITQCPHCFNTFANEYRDFGGSFEVIHHSQLLAQLVTDGKLKPKNGLAQRVTYHDSCYLGRMNGIYEAPRELLGSIPGIELVEMPRNRSRGYCCGAGGGMIFLEERGGRRVNHVRAEEAAATGADAVASACPFCIQMFEEGIAATQPDESKRIKAFDIAELLEVTAVDRPSSQKG
ncbi:MAG TPA: (Fe-S)-binding protein [Dehalococcoidia bacterium]|nr:(Fe-S)-binding protein [Dehalococcoidia bacterium]